MAKQISEGSPRNPVTEPSEKSPGIDSSSGPPFYIVGIGASAGGLEALEEFFSQMPSDSGLAFVVVQHLDPARTSAMPEIMARLTKMPVQLAADGVQVQPNSVYLIPPNWNIGIRKGVLFLQKLGQLNDLRLPVDFFLRSLAKERGDHAICVILSGTGTDGTLGLQAIKAETGTAFVQEPQFAKYDGMPRSAINTGLVDFILPAREMPRQLLEFARHTAANGNRVVSSANGVKEPLQDVFSTLIARTGHDFSGYKRTTVERRLERRMSVNGIDNILDYSRFLKANEPESKALLKDLLISVTSFFRDPEAFNILKEQLRGLIKEKTGGGSLRAWATACATGEEAYSVAMIITEVLGELEKNIQVQIYATDIDAEALTVARTANYPPNIAADMTPERLKRFFLRRENSYSVKKELRDMVVFAPQDLIKDPPFSRMDLICCRNTLIYLESDLQKRLIPLLHYSLNPGGILFLGSSETVGDASDLFKVLDKKWKIFQRREAPVSSERFKFPASFARSPQETSTQAALDSTAMVPALTEKIFLDNYAPTFAVIDEKHRLVYVRGRTGNYLEITSGQPTLSIMEIAREGLKNDLTAAIYQATAENKVIIREGVQVKHNGGFQPIILTVAPLSQYGLPPGLLMVVFQESAAPSPQGKKEPALGRQKRTAIEEELRLTKSNLQRSIEELVAANEEMQSANEELLSNNEELQSTNEELDTSREELQSLNEEMVTVNSEVLTKNELLTKANDDLKNYLTRTDIAIIFVDEELKIRSFTPATRDVFNIREIDIGRPLDEITSRMAYDKVVEDAGEVLRTLTAKELEVQRKDGHWFNMRVLPYLTVQNHMEGLVISFLDIDKQKRAVSELAAANVELKDNLEKLKASEKSLKESEERFMKAFHASPAAQTISLLPEGRWVDVNESFLRMVEYTREEIIGHTSVELQMFPDPNQRDKIRQAFLEKGNVQNLELSIRTKSGRLLTVLSPNVVIRLNDQEHAVSTILDISERKQAEEDLKQYNQNLETVNKELEGFSYSVSHDLKAPLRSLDGFSQAILEDYNNKLDARGKEYLQLIRSSSQLMAKLIEDMLTLSRVTRAEMDLAETNLTELAEDEVAALTRLQPDRNVKFKIEPDLKAFGDRNLLKLAVATLLDNAFKFTGKVSQPMVEFGQRNDNGVPVFFVKDNGAGFDMAYADKLFKPFQRLHSEKEFPGTGIGLAVVQRIINRHGGKVWAESEPGKGATFYFTLSRVPFIEQHMAGLQPLLP